MPRPLDDLGPDFDRRWKQAPRELRRELIASLRDLYLMLEDKDQALLTLLRNGKVPSAYESTDIPLLQSPSLPRAALQQGSLFTDASAATDVALAPPPAEPARKENPFLPRSVLDRLQESRSRASAGLRDLIQNTAEEIARRPVAVELEPEAVDIPPPSHEQSDLERELRLKLGPVVEHLIEAQMEALKNELRVRLRLEMDRLIAEHVRK